MLNVIDLSEWNSVLRGSIVDFNMVLKDVQLSYLRATYSTYYVDKALYKYIKDAKKANMVIGFYAYALPVGSTLAEVEQSAVDHAVFFLEVINKGGGIQGNMLPPVLDIEDANGLSSELLNRFIVTWKGRINGAVKNANQLALGYSYLSFIDTYNLSSEIEWVADYSSVAPNVPHVGWQYTDNSSIQGITGPVDESVFDSSISPIEISAPVVEWSHTASEVTWSFTPPSSSLYRGWNQNIDIGNNSKGPVFSREDNSGWYAYDWAPPGNHKVVLTFFIGGEELEVASPEFTTLDPNNPQVIQYKNLSEELQVLQNQLRASSEEDKVLEEHIASVKATLLELAKSLGI